MKRASALTAVLASAALLAAGCGSSHQATTLPGLTAAKRARIQAVARQTARADGDAHPSSITVFASGRHEANVAAGAGTGVIGSQPVYLVVIRGHFVCSGCSGPAGSTPPTGDVITLVLDRTTLRNLDFGIGGNAHTSMLGPGLPLRLP
ncbi:MAG TPA: hypothetical protein VFA37_09185 [Gaiellaceae bacterium]|nr:hypothetical protein [Gaiellaceae bacterium]